LLAARWPSCAATVARTASHCAEAQEIIDRVAERKLGLAKGSRPGTLSVKRLLELEFPLVKAVLRHWLREQEFPTPDSRRLERVVLDMLRAGEDRSPLVRWSGCEVRRYRDDLFAMAPMPDPPEDLTLFWMRGTLQLPPGLGRLRVSGDAVGDLDPSALFPAGLKVSFGCEGLRCRPASRARHRKLKQLFQEAGVPPWLRPYVPYLFSGGQLIAVGDLWRCVEARPGAQPLWRISWEGGVRDHSGFSP
jgi:tRNA(Ile)-lysidine synthase